MNKPDKKQSELHDLQNEEIRNYLAHEIAQAAKNKVISWAKWIVSITLIILTLFGIKSYLDFTKVVKSVDKKIEKTVKDEMDIHFDTTLKELITQRTGEISAFSNRISEQYAKSIIAMEKNTQKVMKETASTLNETIEEMERHGLRVQKESVDTIKKLENYHLNAQKEYTKQSESYGVSDDLGERETAIAEKIGERVTSTTKKIIHLSELLVRKNIEKKNSNYDDLKCLVDNIILQASPATDYIIVITGDLVDGARKQNCGAVQEQLDKLKKEGFIVLIVPGNHDYGWRGNLYKNEYVDMFNKTFFREEHEREFPRLDIIEDIAFIGLDTTEGVRNTDLMTFATGELGERQLMALDNLFKTYKVKTSTYKVVYMHHSPLARGFTTELTDVKKLRKILGYYNIDIMLFGNTHVFESFNGMWGSIKRSYDAGSSIKGITKIRFIDIGKETDTEVNLSCKSQSESS
jgi:hypothetical protein